MRKLSPQERQFLAIIERAGGSFCFSLLFLCQRCHNRMDAKSRAINAAITRHEKNGQLDLIGREG